MRAHASCAKEHHLKAPGDDLLTLILLGWETNEWRTRRDTDLSKVAIKWKWAQYTGQQLEQFLMAMSVYESTKYRASVHWYEQIQLYHCMFTGSAC